MSSSIAPVISAIIESVVSAISDEAANPAPAPVPYVALARPFPEGSRKGQLYPPLQQQVRIDRTLFNAAPGLQVRNEQNMIVMPGNIQSAHPIRYQLDPAGNVWRIWILTAAEKAAP